MPFTPLIQKLIEESIALYAQPIANLHTGAISHYEILSRFRQNEIYYSPLEFVQWLEVHQLTHFLDRFVIAGTLRHIAQVGAGDRYAVNLSADTINQNGQFSKFLATQQALYGFTELPLIVEITERVTIQATTQARSVLSFLRAIGCSLAVDDFGAPDGIFSIPALDLLQPQYLKIDGWYTNRLPDPTAIADINAFCQIAQCRGIKTILEQVEDHHMDAVISKTDVDLIQGYAIGHPKILLQ